jgi:Protein of unknown function (DUF1552)
MPTKRFSRRTVLRGALATGAAVTVPLPVLDIMLNGNGTAFAQGAPLTRRYIDWFFGNGVLPPLWVPSATGTGSAWTLSPQLMPLTNVKSWLTVVSGLANKIGNADTHITGTAAALTGADTTRPPAVKGVAQLPTIDQVVAGLNPGGTFKSLEVGCSPATSGGEDNEVLLSISHRGPGAVNPVEFDPHAFYTRIFTGVSTGGNSTQMAKLLQQKKSMLDTLIADANELKARLGTADQARISAHLEAIRQIETQLMTMPTTSTSTIQIPSDPQTAGIKKDTAGIAPKNVNQVMAQMLAVALASDITRNASFMFTFPAAHVFYRDAGTDMNAEFHNTICHGDAGDNKSQTRVNTGVLWAMNGLAVFLEALAGMKEGAGTVLDNSLVYVTSCTSWGKAHSTDEWPVLLVGKAGSALKGDQHLRTANGNLSEVLFTIANIFGGKSTNFGLGAGLVTKEVTGLRVT